MPRRQCVRTMPQLNGPWIIGRPRETITADPEVLPNSSHHRARPSAVPVAQRHPRLLKGRADDPPGGPDVARPRRDPAPGPRGSAWTGGGPEEFIREGAEIPLPLLPGERQAQEDAAHLDSLGVPRELGRPGVREWLRDKVPDLKIGDQRLAAAVAHRRSADAVRWPPSGHARRARITPTAAPGRPCRTGARGRRARDRSPHAAALGRQYGSFGADDREGAASAVGRVGRQFHPGAAHAADALRVRSEALTSVIPAKARISGGSRTACRTKPQHSLR